MRCVRGIFHALEPVTIVSFARLWVSSFHHAVTVLHEHVVPRKRRRTLLVFAQVGEHEPAQLPRRIPGMENVWRGFDRFRRTVDNSSAVVVTPAMVGTANSVCLNNAVLERSPAVRAVGAKQSQAAG